MKKPTLAFIPAKCNETGKEFFIREDYAADDKWVRTYGIVSIPASESASLEVEIEIKFSNHRIGPQYKCPHCGKRYVFLCKDCGVRACCYDGHSETGRCPITGRTFKFTHTSEHIVGSGGDGQ